MSEAKLVVCNIINIVIYLNLCQIIYHVHHHIMSNDLFDSSHDSVLFLGTKITDQDKNTADSNYQGYNNKE